MIRRSHRNNHHMVLDNGTSCMWEFEALGSPIFLLHTVGPFAFHFRIRAVMFHSLLVISHFLVFLATSNDDKFVKTNTSLLVDPLRGQYCTPGAIGVDCHSLNVIRCCPVTIEPAENRPP